MSKDAIIILSLVICATLVTLAFVYILFRKVSKIKIDNQKIEDISGYIHSGAIAFLKREFKIIIPFILLQNHLPHNLKKPSQNGWLGPFYDSLLV